MILVGIDPGSKGGLAWLGEGTVKSIPNPFSKSNQCRHSTLDIEKLDRFVSESIKEIGEPDLLGMEDVHSFPRDSRQAAFSFGWNSGAVAHYFQSLGFDLQFIDPKVWQGKILAPILSRFKSGDLYQDLPRKDLLKLAGREYVKSRFPDLSLIPSPRSKNEHDGMSDAICIADFLRLSAVV